MGFPLPNICPLAFLWAEKCVHQVSSSTGPAPSSVPPPTAMPSNSKMRARTVFVYGLYIQVFYSISSPLDCNLIQTALPFSKQSGCERWKKERYSGLRPMMSPKIPTFWSKSSYSHCSATHQNTETGKENAQWKWQIRKPNISASNIKQNYKNNASLVGFYPFTRYPSSPPR